MMRRLDFITLYGSDAIGVTATDVSWNLNPANYPSFESNDLIILTLQGVAFRGSTAADTATQNIRIRTNIPAMNSTSTNNDNNICAIVQGVPDHVTNNNYFSANVVVCSSHLLISNRIYKLDISFMYGDDNALDFTTAADKNSIALIFKVEYFNK